MNTSLLPRRRTPDLLAGVALVAAVFLAAPARAQESAQPARQPDVPYVPTPQAVVDQMLNMAKLQPGDTHYDLGCGDGRIVVTAAKRGAKKAVGVDINPQRIAESNENAKQAGVTDKVKFVIDDLFTMKFDDADVVTLYLLPSVNMKLRPRLLDELKPGTRIVSHDFDMEDWTPDEEMTVNADDESREHRLYLWVIPAKLAGTWDVTTADGKTATLTLDQKFQNLTGTLGMGPQSLPLQSGKLTGTSLRFATDTSQNGAPQATVYQGSLKPDGTLEGTTSVKDTSQGKWTAKRRDAGKKPAAK